MAKNDKGDTTATPPDLPLSGEEQGADPSTSSGRTDFMVAYHDGPVAIGFGWRHWQRDVAQNIMADEWAAMQARGDFNEFNFTEEQ